MILFQIKVVAGNIKETTLARCFIKVTTRPSFTLLGVIMQINRTINIKIKKNKLQRFSYFLFKPHCSNQRNGSEKTFQAAATKINFKNLKNYL